MTLPLPSVYVIEPTTNCNISCIMCPHNRLKYHGDISLHLVKLIAKQIADSALYIQLYLLGEPTLHKDLPRIISILKRTTQAKVEISTNLNAISSYDEWESILRSGVDKIVCCIEGTTEKSHKFLRPTGDFNAAVKSLKILALAKEQMMLSVEIIVKCIGTIHSKNEKEEFFTYWGGVQGVTPSWSWMNTWANTMPALVNISTDHAPNINIERTACAEIWNKMVIRWNGDVILCCHDWNSSTTINNINSCELVDIWNCKAMNDYRIEHENNKFQGICKNCLEWSTSEEYVTDYKLSDEKIYTPRKTRANKFIEGTC